MNGFSLFVARHWWQLLLGWVTYSTAVNAMRVPRPTDPEWYAYLYRFAHGFAANLVTAFGKIGRTPWPGEIPGASGSPTSNEVKK